MKYLQFLLIEKREKNYSQNIFIIFIILNNKHRKREKIEGENKNIEMSLE